MNSRNVSNERLWEGRLFFVAVVVSLALPNLIYSGLYFFQTLHIMKWTVALFPVACLSLITGSLVLWAGPERARFRIDIFGWVWFALLIYVTLQPLWISVRSVPTFYREWFFFASMWALYVLCLNRFKDVWLTPLLWLATLNGAVNVVFAELQVGNNVDVFGPLKLILPTPGNYIGNTGQQNMLGLWLAIVALGAVFIYLRHGLKGAVGWRRLVALSNLGLLSVALWGLWNSTSRSAILSFMVGVALLALLIIMGRDRVRLRRLGQCLVLLVAVLTISVVLNQGRSGALLYKAKDLIENADTVGGREGIWKTSWTMARQYGVRGVGLGQYKWHYLESQAEAFQRYPDMRWQYTNWAHNEYLQWLCESGVIGFVVLIGLGMWWLVSFSRYILTHRGKPFEDGVLWGGAFSFLIWFDALWTRPFHRIEDALWVSLAFAVVNREIWKLQDNRPTVSFLSSSWIVRGVGAGMAIASLFGLIYLGQGLRGDVTLRRAMQARTVAVQRGLLEKAESSLMVRDLVERQLAYHYISVGELDRDPRALAHGLSRLMKTFDQEPTAEDLRKLMNWAGKLKKRELLEKLVLYLKPGSYTIKSRP